MTYLKSFLLLLYFFILFNLTSSDMDYKKNNKYEEDPFDSFNYQNVVSLNYKNISSYFKEHQIFYIIVYDKSIKESAMFMKVFIETADFASLNHLGVPFVIVNGKYNKEIEKFLPIKGYPMCFFIFNGKPFEYLGPVTKTGMMRFLSKKVLGPVFSIDSVKDIEEQVRISGRVLLSTIKDNSSMIYRSYEAHADMTDDLDSYSCLSDECLKKYGEDITILKNFDEGINQYSKDFGELSKAKGDSVYEFVGTYGIEAGATIDEVYEEMLFSYNRKLLYYCRNESNPNDTSFDKVMKEIGIELRKKEIYALTGDIKGGEIFELIKDFFVIEEQDLPLILYYDLKYQNESSDSYRKINLKEEQLNKEFIYKFLKDINDGKIERDIRTERPMTQQEIEMFGAGYVVGKKFEEEVLNNKNNILVVFSMKDKNCPLCDEYVEAVQKISKKNIDEKNPKCLYAIVDAANNEIKGMEIKKEELPFILLYTNAKAKKEVIRFVPKDYARVSRKEIEMFVEENIKEDNKDNEKKGKAEDL